MSIRVLSVLIAIVLLGAGFVTAQPSLGASAASGQAQAGTASIGAGRLVQAQYGGAPPTPTAAQIQAIQKLEEQSNRPGPAIGPSAGTSGAPQGAEQSRPAVRSAAVGPQLPETFTIFRNTALPSTASNGYGNISGRAAEPSTGQNGKAVFHTDNWFATRSLNNGATWTYVNPYTIFGTDLGGFCCDQVTIYDSGRDAQFWLLQFGTGLKLAISRGTSLFTSWCYYNITPGWFGVPSTTAIDYNEIAVGRRFVYITSNLFPSTGGSGAGMLRLPIDALLACAGFSYNFIHWVPGDNTGWSFTWVPTLGADEGTMYWGSNWNQTLASGSTFRIFSWAENAGTYFWYDRAITAFVFMTRNSGQNCGNSTTINAGVVKDWCQFNDSRVKGGALGKGVLYFTFDVKQGGEPFYPFPYARMVRFSESTKAYLGKADVWASWGAFQYLDIAPNARGDLGMVVAFGGGTASTYYYPGNAVLIQDDYSPAQPWQISYYNNILRYNTCTSSGLYRYGDYLTARPMDPQEEVWVGTGWIIRGNNCGFTGWYTQVYNLVFGRGRDQNSYYRWNLY